LKALDIVRRLLESPWFRPDYQGHAPVTALVTAIDPHPMDSDKMVIQTYVYSPFATPKSRRDVEFGPQATELDRELDRITQDLALTLPRSKLPQGIKVGSRLSSDLGTPEIMRQRNLVRVQALKLFKRYKLTISDMPDDTLINNNIEVLHSPSDDLKRLLPYVGDLRFIEGARSDQILWFVSHHFKPGDRIVKVVNDNTWRGTTELAVFIVNDSQFQQLRDAIASLHGDDIKGLL
jgi:hypothetical protein